jgi:hypothetical protein
VAVDEDVPTEDSRSVRVRDLVRRATGTAGLREEVKSLRARVADLETAHVRFAELLDLVQELLLPVAMQDEEKVRAAVARYADELDPSAD